MDHPVRTARKTKSMTQAELADKCGVDRSMISRIERGEDCTLRTLRALGQALEVDYRLLMPAADAGAPRLEESAYSEACGG